MELRPELMPPALDEAAVERLARLASHIDGAGPGQWEDELEEFNRLAGTDLGVFDFQGIYKAEEHDVWVRRLLWYQRVRPVPDVTREELAEVVRRAMPTGGDPQYEGYMAVFDANVPLPGASNLIFYPPDDFPPDSDPRRSRSWSGPSPSRRTTTAVDPAGCGAARRRAGRGGTMAGQKQDWIDVVAGSFLVMILMGGFLSVTEPNPNQAGRIFRIAVMAVGFVGLAVAMLVKQRRGR